ncbi:MAG: hypothetical protein JJ934_14520 [Pseudomonadales bacterium]|nr:hypothetical protein [Pseudomonadales bacterium]MBO6658109.1 hypothetical protein [Pseudomonadales bacterium]
MRDVLIDALKKRFASYQDIIDSVTDDELGQKLDVPKHKALAEHMWCVVGARESYAKAITDGSWMGFSCSLTSFGHADFVAKLASSANDVIAAIDSLEDWNDEREALLLTLFEHEVMHEGQIIRHLYGAEHNIPETVKWA